MNVWVYVCMHMFQCKYIKPTPVAVDKVDICHWTNMAATLKIWLTAIMLIGHIDQQLYIHLPKHKQLQQLIHVLLPCMCHKGFRAKRCHLTAACQFSHQKWSCDISMLLISLKNWTLRHNDITVLPKCKICFEIWNFFYIYVLIHLIINVHWYNGDLVWIWVNET